MSATRWEAIGIASRRPIAPCLAALVLAAACRTAGPEAPPAGVPVATPAPAASAPTEPAEEVVRTAPEPLALTAWVEPAHLPPEGGVVDVFVRVRREDGGPYPGVDVLLRADRGALASGGRVLRTDDQGVVRDRLRTRRTAALTVNAGGTIYRFPVPVLPASADPSD